VVLIVDAGALYAQADADEPSHASITSVLRREREPLVTTELVVAEADCLILRRLGVAVELAFLEDLATGTYLVECLGRGELNLARSVVERYRDLHLGLADASLIVISHRYRANRILTLDQRAFRTVLPLLGGTFTVLPADAE
jgi:predicted nucleic acid-binding protein